MILVGSIPYCTHQLELLDESIKSCFLWCLLMINLRNSGTLVFNFVSVMACLSINTCLSNINRNYRTMFNPDAKLELIITVREVLHLLLLS